MARIVKVEKFDVCRSGAHMRYALFVYADGGFSVWKCWGREFKVLDGEGEVSVEQAAEVLCEYLGESWRPCSEGWVMCARSHK